MQTLQSKIETAANKERYCIHQLAESLNSKSDKYLYEFHTTGSHLPICYDAILYIRCKLTQHILFMYLVEVKVRETFYELDTLVFEKKKLVNLQKERTKFVRTQLPSFVPEILYISFTPENTYMYFIDDLIKNQELPDVQYKSMNVTTVAKDNKKIDKAVYMLDKKLAVVKPFKYDAKKYADSLIRNINKEIKLVKTVISLF